MNLKNVFGPGIAAAALVGALSAGGAMALELELPDCQSMGMEQNEMGDCIVKQTTSIGDKNWTIKHIDTDGDKQTDQIIYNYNENAVDITCFSTAGTGTVNCLETLEQWTENIGAELQIKPPPGITPLEEGTPMPVPN